MVSSMVTVKEHYENHLAKYYSWMSGGFTKKLEENRKFFKDHNLWPRSSGVAVDLGAGPGFQSILFAELGYHVMPSSIIKRLDRKKNVFLSFRLRKD